MAALVVAIAVAVATIAASVFAGISMLISARQTKHMYAATELTFNLEVMMRLDDTLTHISTDEDLQAYIWREREGNTHREVAGDRLLDVIAMALKAVERLPGFQTNDEDWYSYATYVMSSSDVLRRRVLENPAWWSELLPFAQDLQAESSGAA